MGRYTGPTCRLCRREGMKLYLKGDKCYTDKCPFARRGYAPGQHGQEKKKLTNYGMQLREKQKLKRYYGVLERQFERLYEEAERMKGITGENLLQLLERRLDNVVFRLGFAASRPQARQLVSHGHIEVNGKKVDIPSFLVKPGDVISVREKSRSMELIKNNLEVSRNVPDWLELNKDAFEGRVVSLPRREHIDLPIQEHLIVELYSK
ncbi:30S ribosomal protein S4 [Thermoanaerobacter sp. CM-CNRG TB177]|jgi:small subunit ribosomal protein S4|uniref:Small ribosomal subunit protein uS4 n=3 Tax=Thermoanaerobacter TaxID=1754 RepID=RS4_THEP3|nr:MULTISPECIES: 30S ribosomal protein S4 [Thermoanaerobacter]B0K5S0.1 RecName: Full=Small ribosomal subunit protein uS4; AltName: Full=30S ribosomal protein S4 [Thermoanaerobacter sp. X514]B0KCM7.1 RecName: Full=Small ribosomal subunit protein uS4; AltName: Full=30S ribosomal protein S4 [Thermoanaerobacter pseudethanolicus ATCC 33223]KUJ89933.1 MAG: 30S ribosomal protein S4 [Thermoanaerobacter thermocopriae]KUK35382.1 MAG: 30S ribosomal protein S4 [Caldanaerobacter subterraneus]ABY92196.1 RNA